MCMFVFIMLLYVFEVVIEIFIFYEFCKRWLRCYVGFVVKLFECFGEMVF